ncbi:MAG: hypothetical protein HQ552_10240 [Desulfobacteraceae bacterium]|nr:hypothetical protein [Desulfobacteraceae bacterium]
MIKYFTNREISEKLEINLARWKRWSREFIPPDPLGGMQTGYARQYHPDEAFNVHLGGHLVSDLKFAIPEAKQILADLQGWLADKGFYFNVKGGAVSQNSIEALIKEYIVFISKERLPDNTYKFKYTVRGIISNKPVRYQNFEIMEELYTETVIGLQPDKSAVYDTNAVKTLHISGVLNNFVARMDLEQACYPALNPHIS